MNSKNNSNSNNGWTKKKEIEYFDKDSSYFKNSPAKTVYDWGQKSYNGVYVKDENKIAKFLECDKVGNRPYGVDKK